MSAVEEIQIELKKLHQERASCEDIIHFSNLIKQHGKSLDESEYNAFMKIVFITIRNVLKRPRLSATERMHLLELLELRARGWNPDSSTNKCDSRRANNAELFKTPTPPQVQRPDPTQSLASTENFEPEPRSYFTVGPIRENRCTVQIKNKHIGSVIGRKGCRVSAIRRYTKTGLFVESASGYLTEDTIRQITLNGESANIRRAIVLIRLLVDGADLPEEVWKYEESVNRERHFSTGDERSKYRDSLEEPFSNSGFGKEVPNVCSPRPFGSGVKPKYAVSSPISARGSRSFLSEKTSSWNSTNVGDAYASSSRGSLSSRSTQNRSGHQLSDSGHHEDLSPGGKRRISTKEKGCTFFERLTIRGHDVELLVDDEDLLRDIVDLLQKAYDVGQEKLTWKEVSTNGNPSVWDETSEVSGRCETLPLWEENWNDGVYEPQKSAIHERNREIAKARAPENVSRFPFSVERKSQDTPAGFPLGRGRGQRGKRPEQPSDKNRRPQGLADKKNSKLAAGFGYAVKELKEFMSKQSNSDRVNQISSEDKEWEPYRNDCVDKWLLEIEPGQRVTSTPAVIHQDCTTNSNWRENDNAQMFTGSFLERREANDVQDSRVELSTLNKGYLIESLESSDASRNSCEAWEAMHPITDPWEPQTDAGVGTSSKRHSTSECDEDNASSERRNSPFEYIMHCNNAETRIRTINEALYSHMLGMRQPLNILREPINPLTPLDVVLAIEKEMPSSSLCAAKRRELFAATSIRLTGQDVPRTNSDMLVYSRQQLLRFCQSELTLEEPRHWSLLTKVFPQVCLLKPWGFSLQEFTSAALGFSMLPRQERRPYNNGEALFDQTYLYQNQGSTADHVKIHEPVELKLFGRSTVIVDGQNSGDVRIKDEVTNELKQNKFSTQLTGNATCNRIGDSSCAKNELEDPYQINADDTDTHDPGMETENPNFIITKGVKSEPKDGVQNRDEDVLAPILKKETAATPALGSVACNMNNNENSGETTSMAGAGVLEATSAAVQINTNEIVSPKLDSRKHGIGEKLYGDISTKICQEQGTADEATSVVPNFVQEAILSFNEEKDNSFLHPEKMPGITWSKWGLRPKGVKESVAEVIPQPAVSLLSRGVDNQEIEVRRLNTYCMDDLVEALRQIEDNIEK